MSATQLQSVLLCETFLVVLLSIPSSQDSPSVYAPVVSKPATIILITVIMTVLLEWSCNTLK